MFKSQVSHVKLLAKQMMLGIEFQSLGAAAWNDLSPFFDLVGGVTSSLCKDERNERCLVIKSLQRK